MNIPCSIFFHNYYGQHDYWIKFFCEKMNVPFYLLYNIVEDSLFNSDMPDEIERWLTEYKRGNLLEKIIVRKSPNIGKDIGGKMILTDTFLQLDHRTEYIIFLHDKKSPHKIQNEAWQQKLCKIIQPWFSKKALTEFSNNAKTGIVAFKETVLDEFDHSVQNYKSVNGVHLEKLQSVYNVIPENFEYVAGTMFWVRANPLISFFEKHHPLSIRKTLERGNVLDEYNGSITHAWERFLTWIIVSQGYTIKKLSDD